MSKGISRFNMFRERRVKGRHSLNSQGQVSIHFLLDPPLACCLNFSFVFCKESFKETIFYSFTLLEAFAYTNKKIHPIV